MRYERLYAVYRVGVIRRNCACEGGPAAPGKDVAPIVTVADELDQARKSSAVGIAGSRRNETA